MSAVETPWEKAKISERLGVISCLHHISSLVGGDIGDLAKWESTIKLSGYQAVRLDEHRILYFHSSGPYNINVLYSLYFQGLDEPLVIIGEAKGEDSPFTTLRQPNIQAPVSVTTSLRQDHFLYPIGRAEYMIKPNVGTAISQVRRDVGKFIIDAKKHERLLYIGVRGMYKEKDLVSNRLFLKFEA